MFTKESVEKKWSDYSQAAQQDGKVSALPRLLKTTGVLAGVALVPCLSAGTAQAAIVTGTNFTGGPVVSAGNNLGAFNGLASWAIGGSSTSVTMSWSGGSGEVLQNSSYAMVLGANVAISSGAGTFSDYMRMPAGEAGYLGIEFQIENTHYGWIQVEVSGDGGSMEVIKWGYNDVAGEAVQTPIPEPASLALLACGAAGLVAKRRKKKASA